MASSLSTIQDNEDDEEALAAAELEAEAAANVNGLNQTQADLASQDNVYKPIEFEVKTAASGTVFNSETHASKSETISNTAGTADHDEDSGNPADDPRFISKKLIPAIGGYTIILG